MDCFEKGLPGLKDTDGLELRWGNTDAIVRMVDKIAQRQGFGDVLAEGSRHAAAASVSSLELMLKDYYRLRGLDANGRPTTEKLHSLGISDLAVKLQVVGLPNGAVEMPGKQGLVTYGRQIVSQGFRQVEVKKRPRLCGGG